MWWIINFDIPANPGHDEREIDEEGIVPGPIIAMTLLVDIALGDDEQSSFY